MVKYEEMHYHPIGFSKVRRGWVASDQRPQATEENPIG